MMSVTPRCTVHTLLHTFASSTDVQVHAASTVVPRRSTRSSLCSSARRRGALQEPFVRIRQVQIPTSILIVSSTAI
eukprot:6194617-Pleurochrysis_carterae.AAC.1